MSEESNQILFGKGYVLVPNLLCNEKIILCNEIIKNLLKSESADISPEKSHRRRRIFNLIYEGKVFQEILMHSRILELVREVLNAEFIVSDFSAHLLAPGSSGQSVHVDYPYWMMDSPYPSHPVMSVQVIWLINDFTRFNGATRYAPGTQTLCSTPNHDQFLKIAEPIKANAGDVIVAHGLCWHDTLPNTTNMTRTALLINYTPKFVRSSIDIMRKDRYDLMLNYPVALRSLTGLDS
jgi:ectoine hydroxylase-related dioxygenase (phytanoyl-CoA dioxygenase family)